MSKGMGAKKRMGIMQGRGCDDVCVLCQEESTQISQCTGCGDFICKECRMDHDCTTPTADDKTKKK